MAACRILFFAVLTAVFLATPVQAEQVGVVAGAEGTAEIGRGGTWTPASVGDPVHQGDILRTGKPGRLRVLFQDESMITLGDESEMEVTRKIFNPDQGAYRSLMKLIRGRVRTFVSEYYSSPKASYQIETRTAVAGVRGTEFIMTYDVEKEVSEVIGITSVVEVTSIAARSQRSVLITAREITVVEKGNYPTVPRQLDDELFRQYLDGLQLIDAGRSESLAVGSSVASGESVADEHTASSMQISVGAPTIVSPDAADPAQESAGPDAGNLLGQPLPVVEEVTSPGGEIGIEF